MKSLAIVVCLLGLSIVAAELVAPKAISDVDAEWTEAEYADGPAAFVETEAEAETDAEAAGISHTIAGHHGMVTYISPGHRINSGIAYSAPASVEVVNTRRGLYPNGPIVDETRTRLVADGAVIPPAAAVHPVVNAIQGIDQFDYAVPVAKYFRPRVVGHAHHVHGGHHHHRSHRRSHSHSHGHGSHSEVSEEEEEEHVHSHPIVDGYEYHYGGRPLVPVRPPASASWLWHSNGPVTGMSTHMEGSKYASWAPTGVAAVGSVPVALYSDGTPHPASMRRFGGAK